MNIKEYKEKLLKGIEEYMAMPVSQRSTEAIRGMLECYSQVCEMECDENHLSPDEAKMWVDGMENEDGTTGAHWTIEETNTLPKPESVSAHCWNAAMNMMYSDYYDVAVKYGVNVPEFYADMATAFLCDKDAKDNKLAIYYHDIVE